MQDVVEKISEVDIDDHGFPMQPIQIVDRGIIPVSSPYLIPHPDDSKEDKKK